MNSFLIEAVAQLHLQEYIKFKAYVLVHLQRNTTAGHEMLTTDRLSFSKRIIIVLDEASIEKRTVVK
jgi:hypothetical protein